MGSKGRIPPSHLRRPVPGPGMVHPDPFGPGILPPLGHFPHFEMLPPPEIMEQKLAAQHVEMQKLGTENQRLAATHGTLRQKLAAAQYELQMLHAQVDGIKSEREQQIRNLTDKIAKMEGELQAAQPVKIELQQAHAEAKNLVLAREELSSKVQQLNQDLQRAHIDVQQIPALMGELDSLRQEYQHCRATFDYEKKFYNDHLESLQVMEKNYMTMAREVEKLRAQLMSGGPNFDRRTVGQYGGATGNNENEVSGQSAGQNAYEDGYGIHQRNGHLTSVATGATAGSGTAVYVGAQSGAAPTRTGYELPRGPAYDASKGLGYDMSRGPGYESQRGAGYDTQRAPNYDGQRVAGYDTHRGPVHDASRAAAYDASARNLPMPHGQAVPPNTGPYGSATPPARAGSGYEAATRGGTGNPPRR